MGNLLLFDPPPPRKEKIIVGNNRIATTIVSQSHRRRESNYPMLDKRHKTMKSAHVDQTTTRKLWLTITPKNLPRCRYKCIQIRNQQTCIFNNHNLTKAQTTQNSNFVYLVQHKFRWVRSWRTWKTNEPNNTHISTTPPPNMTSGPTKVKKTSASKFVEVWWNSGFRSSKLQGGLQITILPTLNPPELPVLHMIVVI